MKTLAVALACLSSAFAGSVTLTMDEVPTQAINGLVVTKGGITFTFSDPGLNDFYNSPNGGQMTYVQDPSLEGQAADVFTITFSAPMFDIFLGMAESTMVAPGAQLASVNLYNGVTLLGTQTFNSTLADPFDEGQFIYQGSLGLVTSIQITPNNTGTPAMAIDNLFVATSPEPSTLMSSFAGATVLAGIALLRRRRRSVLIGSKQNVRTPSSRISR
jgi:hypothetical protein